MNIIKLSFFYQKPQIFLVPHLLTTLTLFFVIQINSKTNAELQKQFKEFNKKLNRIEKGLNEIKDITMKTLTIVEDMRYKKGLETIESNFLAIMNGYGDLEETLR